MELRQLKDKATEAFTKGRFSKAAELYDEYCRADPKDHQSRLRLGDAWSKAGQRVRAIAAYQSAAEGFAREGFLPRAIAASKLILELDPQHSGVQQMLADLYARRGTPASPRARRPEGPPPAAATAMGPELPVPLASPRPTPLALDVAGAPVDLSDELPLELARPMAAVESDAVVVTVEVEVEPADVTGVEIFPADASGPVDTRSLPPGMSPRGAGRAPAVGGLGGATPGTAPASSTASAARAGAGGLPEAAPWPVAAATVDAGARAELAPRTEVAPGVAAAPGGQPSRWTALAAPMHSAAPTSEPTVARAPTAAPPGLRPRRAEAAHGANSAARADAAPRASVPVSAPARPSAVVSSFTELELEADSLLHAVELAARAGSEARAVDVSVEEEAYPLTEELGAESADLEALPSIPLFSDLPREAFIALFERCPLRRFGAGERIIEQGSLGDAFYVICEGRVRVFREDSGRRDVLATLEGGTFFGEMALLSGAPRTASVEGASEDTQLLEISASVLAELSRSYPQVAQALKKFCRERLLVNVMNGSALFRPFSRKDRRGLVERFRARDVERDDVIIRDGAATDGLYVVLSGEVEVHKDGHLLTRLKEGDLFGEISLLQKTPATATVMAARHTTLLRLPREDFDQLISSHPQILVLVSELTDERLRRTEALLSTHAAGTDTHDLDEDLILV
ncbi:cyclic nucleotide-binding domain-containing protein [Corallococcus sp. M34]|uniref:cyclic nucleotide-binding domain-containing protein n=1 Tax=Citreicoccus inhibens TaxID=2849499 RepID=UPI001C22A038|nr:cyclic nucleotide-binding domain-containing protein [Citreicoccus inhibens]MBU8894692.1 cyclic nucleotide-binding domain-containing protein [Citreicoccus inhibens]